VAKVVAGGACAHHSIVALRVLDVPPFDDVEDVASLAFANNDTALLELFLVDRVCEARDLLGRKVLEVGDLAQVVLEDLLAEYLEVEVNVAEVGTVDGPEGAVLSGADGGRTRLAVHESKLPEGVPGIHLARRPQ